MVVASVEAASGFRDQVHGTVVEGDVVVAVFVGPIEAACIASFFSEKDKDEDEGPHSLSVSFLTPPFSADLSFFSSSTRLLRPPSSFSLVSSPSSSSPSSLLPLDSKQNERGLSAFLILLLAVLVLLMAMLMLLVLLFIEEDEEEAIESNGFVVVVPSFLFVLSSSSSLAPSSQCASRPLESIMVKGKELFFALLLRAARDGGTVGLRSRVSPIGGWPSSSSSSSLAA